MAEPVEGTWKCTVLGGDAGADEKDIIHVRINLQIEDGPDRGRRMTYDEQVNNKSAKYIAMSARAVGWRGGRLEERFRGDVEEWVKATGGASTVEIVHIARKNGPKAGTMWAKARSVGRGQKPLVAPSRQSADDADEAMRAALAEDGGGGSAPAYDDIPAHGDDDIPFISSSMTFDMAVRSWR